VAGRGGATPDGNAVSSRRRVSKTLDALGELGSPAGSCVWHVVGLQRSIREWVMRQGWGGPVRVEQAQEILVAGLENRAVWESWLTEMRITKWFKAFRTVWCRSMSWKSSSS
jgi:hypothetical protein